MNRYRNSFVLLAAAILTGSLQAPAADKQPEEKVLRVCQDPNNLPFSHRDQTGFENKIAELFAQDLGWKLEHTWYPQRMGFIRNTLKAKEPNSEKFKCDLVTSVSSDFDLGFATKPYYTSTYTMAFVKGRGLDDIKSPEDLIAMDPSKRKKLRLGVFARSPVADWLLKNNMIEQVVPFHPQTGDPAQYTGELIEKELLAGNIDAAFVWGPIAGYFAKKSTTPIAVLPFKADEQSPLQFNIAMGVRFGEKAMRDRIDKLIEKNQEKIQQILANYGVPLLKTAAKPTVAATPTDASAGKK
ncbi:MAG: quinoprotein dehydrogenase-associated putative ABC transporter substrate-binding protein [Burkholderiales bacterium]